MASKPKGKRSTAARASKRRPGRRSAQRPAKKGPSPGAVELDHLFLGTSDFVTSWSFWADTVGLEGLSSWGEPKYAGSLKLGAGSITVAAGNEGPYEELKYDVRHGRPQLFLRTPDLEGLHRRMVARGARILAGPLTTHWGAKCFSAAAPDGLVVVFVQGK
jgi:hypothetical protein